MGLEPISQPMPAVSTHSIVDVLSHSSVGGNSPATPVSMSALFPNMSAVTSEPSVPPKMPKNEYKPEQLATLLQAAASQQGSTTLTPVMSSAQGLTVTPTNGNFQSFNGTTLYKQSFGPQATNGGTAFPPTATLLQNPSPLQNKPTKERLKSYFPHLKNKLLHIPQIIIPNKSTTFYEIVEILWLKQHLQF